MACSVKFLLEGGLSNAILIVAIGVVEDVAGDRSVRHVVGSICLVNIDI